MAALEVIVYAVVLPALLAIAGGLFVGWGKLNALSGELKAIRTDLNALKERLEPLFSWMNKLIVDTLTEQKGNPSPGERREELLAKLRENSLSAGEAGELEAILSQEYEEAKKQKNTAMMIAIGLGLALLASQHKKSKA